MFFSDIMLCLALEEKTSVSFTELRFLLFTVNNASKTGNIQILETTEKKMRLLLEIYLYGKKLSNEV
jgi:hypothetical protein